MAVPNMEINIPTTIVGFLPYLSEKAPQNNCDKANAQKNIETDNITLFDEVLNVLTNVGSAGKEIFIDPQAIINNRIDIITVILLC